MTRVVLEPGCGLPADRLPEYAAELHAGHTAHEAELRAAMSSVGFPSGGRVVDLACGDGCHLAWLGELVAQATGVDRSPALLDRARRRLGSRAELILADAAALPLPEARFDGAWCAHSLWSLPDVAGALVEMRRVLRPGGRLALLETDLLHGMVLPWPADLELAVRAAQMQDLARAASERGLPVESYYNGRNLERVLAAAGLVVEGRRTVAIDRRPPYAADEERHLRCLLSDLRRRAAPFLARADRARLDALLQAGGPDDMLAQENTSVTFIELVAVATRR